MKRVVFILVALSGLTTACNPSDSNGGKMWRRTVEPRLSGDVQWQPCQKLQGKQLIANVQCGQPRAGPAKKQDCERVIATSEEARRQLVEAPHCLDQVIDNLTRFARASPEALNDLAAAHYVRAQRNDEPSHLLHALHAATEAVTAQPQSAAARFNQALVQEALEFHAEAIASWDAFLELDGRSKWAAEARRRRDALKLLVIPSAEERWSEVEKQLNAAVAARDQDAVRRLIKEFPGGAYEYFNKPSSDEEASVMAKPLSERLGGDSEPLDRAAKGSIALQSTASRARTMLRDNPDGALVILDDIAPAARNRNYRYLAARIQAMRGYALVQQGRYVEALAAYEDARETYESVDDRENLSIVFTRTQGIYTLAGALERGWRDGYRATRYLRYVRAYQYRHGHYGETARLLHAFGYQRLALSYQSIPVGEAERRLQRASEMARPALLMNLAIALRGRADLEVQLRLLDAAQKDLERALVIAREHSDPEVREGLTARLQDVRGESLVKVNPRLAIQAFTDALNHAGPEFPTFRAKLYERRARAHLALQQTDPATADLERAIEVLRQEQRQILARRHRTEAADFWSPYFSRFRETYDLLIQHMIEVERRPTQAFYYNERARATEPLNLIEQLDLLSPDLRRRLRENRIDLPYIQSSLPPNTYLLQYTVLSERTYAWIVSRDLAVVTPLRATRDDVQRWAEVLQDAVEDKDDTRFEAGLAAPFTALFEYPLAFIRKRSAVRVPRVVIIPDGPMHGLPFPALQNSKTDQYLIQQVIAEVAGSTALYLVSLERDRALPRMEAPSIALFGDPAFGETLQHTFELPRLPGAEAEVREVAREYDDGVTLKLGAEATARTFIALAPASAIVHIAAHAVANAQVPHRSFIALAADGSDPGDLDALELLTQVKIDRTRLVCLSTCSSAGGAPVGLEGVAPLVRPFIGAGVPAVIGSLWTVNDATTKHLLVSFHRHYRAGRDAAEAMRQAQIEMLGATDAAQKAAHAWGSFQVIGHASSPFESPAPTKQEKKPP